MSQAVFSATPTDGAIRRARSRIAISLLAVAGVALLAGCATNRDSITVGAIPDDYRTNHPIVIAERQQVIDIPVGNNDRGISKGIKETFAGYLSGYDRQTAPVLTILVPSGAANDVAANEAARALMRVAVANGVPAGRVSIARYQAAYPDVAAPVRVSYTALRAQTNRCGRWPEDVLDTAENKHYANFGCSYQNNIAAQIANPTDLLGPRQQTTIDAERRAVIIDGYRNVPFYSPVPRTEVFY